MDLELALLVAGPLLGPVAVVAAVVAALQTRAARSSPVVVLAWVEGALVVAYWVVWWFAFDWVDGEAVPNRLFEATTPLMAGAAVGCFLLAGAVVGEGLTARARARSRRSWA